MFCLVQISFQFLRIKLYLDGTYLHDSCHTVNTTRMNRLQINLITLRRVDKINIMQKISGLRRF